LARPTRRCGPERARRGRGGRRAARRRRGCGAGGVTTGGTTVVGPEAPLAADLHLPTTYGRAERLLDVAIRSVVPVVLAGVAGASWTVIPALLKARYGTNEIITTLMMSFIGVDLASILIKGPFHDPTTPLPQTQVIPLDKMLPSIPGTRIHVGVLVAVAAI